VNRFSENNIDLKQQIMVNRTAPGQSTGIENIGQERVIFGPDALGPVNSPGA